MSKLTLDEAIKHCLKVAKQEENSAIMFKQKKESSAFLEKAIAEKAESDCRESAAEHRQLAEWLTELEEAKGIIRVCNRVLGYLLECEIESTSTRHEVETLLKNITEFLSGGSENGS